MADRSDIKPVRWIASSRDDLRRYPDEVQNHIGYALYVAQIGDIHPSARPLKGFGGAGVLEVVKESSGGTFRAVYTVRFDDALHVLHVFQKKSKHGVTTPARELKIVRSRLSLVEANHKARRGTP